MQKIFTLLMICLFASGLQAQKGRVEGTVTDSKTGETLPGATILIDGTAKAAITDFDGKFSLNGIEPGKVTLAISYISYTSKKIAEVTVKPNEVTEVNVTLDPSSSKDLTEVVVVVTLNKENNTALVLQQKNNASVSDGISAETIKKTPDRNTSDVLKRVSGASIQDNKFAIVRGLNERYNAAYLNGAPLPSSESDRKAFSFDVFPSNMLDNLVITKTARPDMPGEFAGGIIDITTKSIPEKNFFTVSTTGGYNTIATFKDKYAYKGSKTDWLGFDNGARAFPSNIPSNADYPRANKDAQAQLAKNTPVLDWSVQKGKFMPNIGLQMTGGYNWKLKERDFLGVIASVSYNKTNSYIKAIRNSFSDNNDPLRASQLDAIFNDNIYSTQILAGALLNITCKLTSNSTISVKNLLSTNSDDQTILRNGDGNLAGANQTLSKTTAQWFTSNRIFSSQLIGEHFLPKAKLKISWIGSISDVKRQIPALRRNTYGRFKDVVQDPSDTIYQAVISESSVGSNYGGYMFWSSLAENLKSIKADAARSFKISSDFSFEIKMGGMVQLRERSFVARQLGYTQYSSGPAAFTNSLTYLPGDQIFSQQNMGLIAPGQGGFKITEGTVPTDSYDALSNLNAAYAMADIKPAKFLRAIIGARFESYRQQLIFPGPFFVFNREKITTDTTVNDLLPSVNLIFSIGEKQNIRTSFSKTLNRPEFREIAPFGFYDFTTLFFTSGNSSLQRAQIYNYDLRYEIYPGRGQLFSASAFYKDFINPIEQVALTNANEISYGNVPRAKAYGIELEYRVILGAFTEKDSTVVGKFLNNTTLFTNAALIKSVVDVSQQISRPADAPTTRPLQGQSPYLFNAGLIYNDNEKGYSISAIVNRIGSRIAVIGNYNSQLDIWEKGRTVLDMQVSKSFLKNKLDVRISARDILAKYQKQYFYNNKDSKNSLDTSVDDVIRTVRFGTTFSIQLTYKF